MNWNWLHTYIQWHGEKVRSPNLLTSGAWRLIRNKCYISVDLWTSALCIPYLSLFISGRTVFSVATVLWFPVYMIFNTRQEFKITDVLTVLHCHGRGTAGTTEIFEIFYTRCGTESWVLCQLRYFWERKKWKKHQLILLTSSIVNAMRKNGNEKQDWWMCLAKITKIWNHCRTNKQ